MDKSMREREREKREKERENLIFSVSLSSVYFDR